MEEKRLIDVEDAIERAIKSDKIVGSSIWETSEVVEFLEDCPIVEAVEVVRCKDCKHYHADTLSCDFTPHGKYYERPNWYEDDFCSYGERKDK